MHTHHSDSDDKQQLEDSEGQSLDDLLAKAVDAVAKGENPDQVLEIMLLTLPAKMRDKMRKIFAAALAKRGLRQLAGEADLPSRATLTRIRDALAMTTRQMIDRIQKLLARRPDLAAIIQQAGQSLTRNGVRNDQVPLTEADLGTIAPMVTAARGTARDQGAGRGT